MLFLHKLNRRIHHWAKGQSLSLFLTKTGGSFSVNLAKKSPLFPKISIDCIILSCDRKRLWLGIKKRYGSGAERAIYP